MPRILLLKFQIRSSFLSPGKLENCEGEFSVGVSDYIDCNVPTLKKMYEKRLIGYRTLGYIIEEKSSSKAEQMKLF